MFRICIAGAGGIGRAVAVLLREYGEVKFDIHIGDINLDASFDAKTWIEKAGQNSGFVRPFDMKKEGWQEKLGDIDLVLDCLPGKFAPKMAQLALDLDAHYVNLTEYVAETKQIMALVKGAKRGFGLQSGVAPGFVNVLGKRLFEEFCAKHGVEKANDLEMRVGALSRNTVAPHYYGFTWSTIGVATEYVKTAEVVRDHKFIEVPSLTGRRELMVDGLLLEEDFTSGGAADIPVTYQEQIANIDYKTLRYPGHWAWVDELLKNAPEGEEKIDFLEREMLKTIPAVEEDLIIVYAAVEGHDKNGVLRRMEASYYVEPLKIGEVSLRAIQSTTAAGMAEIARLVLSGKYQGTLLQSQVDTADYLNGPFVRAVYGERR
jgi:saccharopine dehydrogenase-like NADP-dependent oxidoreductase